MIGNHNSVSSIQGLGKTLIILKTIGNDWESCGSSGSVQVFNGNHNGTTQDLLKT